MKAPPAFQFYAADYLADEHVQLMSLEEEGIYVRLMSYCWREGSISNDPEILSRLCKGGSTTAIRVVLARFQPHPTAEGRLVHSRLEGEREKQAKWRQKSAEGGRKSVESRAKPPILTTLRVVEPPLNHPTNGGSTLQSSSSLALPNGKDAKPSVWDLGEELLTRSGWTKKNSRAFIGRQIKDFDEEAVAEVLGKTALKAPADPGAYIVQTLKQVWIKSGKSPPLGDVIYCPDCNTNGMHELERDGQRGYVPCPNKNGKHT